MASPTPQTETFADERVTTEPQRRTLDAMSQELVNKLNIMVAEQEQRAREFAARQHSLSSLPRQTAPSAPSAPSAVPSANIFSPEPVADVSRAAGQPGSAPLPAGTAGGALAASARTAPPPQPAVRHPLTGLTRPAGGEAPHSGEGSDYPPHGSPFPSPEPGEGKGVSINAGTLIVILLIGLVVLRSCGS